MTDHEAGPSRRAVLAAGLLAAVSVTTGCTSHHGVAVADPDEQALAAARDGELSLLAAYAEGSPAHTAHLAHLRVLGGAATPASAPRSTPATAARSAERASVTALQAAAFGAQRGATAALLASIAASHAVLARVASS